MKPPLVIYVPNMAILILMHYLQDFSFKIFWKYIMLGIKPAAANLPVILKVTLCWGF